MTPATPPACLQLTAAETAYSLPAFLALAGGLDDNGSVVVVPQVVDRAISSAEIYRSRRAEHSPHAITQDNP